jgi:hypothetical protein
MPNTIYSQPYCTPALTYTTLNNTIGQPAARAAPEATMSSTRRQYTTSVTVEVTPSTPPSPKAVRFASTEALSRPVSQTEAWSLFHFESHARQCGECRDPYYVYLKGRRLCPIGHALAQDVAIHVCSRQNEIYSNAKDNHKYVRVEMPHGYDQARGLLRSLDRSVRKIERTVSIISYDRTYPVSPRRREKPASDYEDNGPVSIEPARTPRKPASTRYTYDPQTQVATEETDSSTSKAKQREIEERFKRGSLYEKDMQRPKKEYRVEVREPVEAESRRRRTRDRDDARESEKKREDRHRERDHEERRRRKEEKAR